MACPIKEEKEFLLLAGRTQIQRIDLSNLTYPEILPINTSNVITVVCNKNFFDNFLIQKRAKFLFKKYLF